MNIQTLSECLPHATPENIHKFGDPLLQGMTYYEIITNERIAAFLAQIAHESGSLRYVKEIASGAAYDTGKLAVALGNTPEDDGDGELYKGRGLIQITGRANYKKLSEELDFNFLDHPEKLEMPGAAALSACWWWKAHGLNELADKGLFEKITRRINGGLNGYDDRLKHWETAKKALLK